MKRSFYNFLFLNEKGDVLLYNSRTGAVSKLTRDEYRMYTELLDYQIELNASEFSKALLKNGFAVDDDACELNMIRYESLKERFNSNRLVLGLIPTQDCNYDCSFCFKRERWAGKYMSKAIVDAVIAYAEKNIPKDGHLHVEWHGGEPLLALDTIKHLTKEFDRICLDRGTSYKANIVTNGCLLDEKAAEALIECHIENIQITLDGSEDTHNERRTQEDFTPTYQNIWENIVRVGRYREKLSISLRVLADDSEKEVVSAAAEFVKKKGLDDFVSVCAGSPASEDDCYYSERSCNARETDVMMQQYRYAQQGILPKLFPTPKCNFCCAGLDKSVIINADGLLYKCWSDIGDKERCIGDIIKSEIYGEKLLHQYLVFDAAADEICSECKCLPICMGGCRHDKPAERGKCIYFKEIADKTAKL